MNVFRGTLTGFLSYALTNVVLHAQGVQMQTKKALAAIKGISEAKIDKIREAARKITVRSGIAPHPSACIASCVIF